MFISELFVVKCLQVCSEVVNALRVQKLSNHV